MIHNVKFAKRNNKTFISPPSLKLWATLLRDNCFVRVARHTKRRRREVWSVAHKGACDAPTSVLGNYFQKCLFANAYPEPVLRYCSNSNAASFELNAK